MTIRQTAGGQCGKDIPDVCLYYILSVLFTKRALEQHKITRHNVELHTSYQLSPTIESSLHQIHSLF